MIVDPTEQSPLKAGGSPPSSPVQGGLPPPPYSAVPLNPFVLAHRQAASARGQNKSTWASPVLRFAKAFVLAVFLLVIVCMSIESIELAVNFKYPWTTTRITGSVFGNGPGSSNLPIITGAWFRGPRLPTKLPHKCNCEPAMDKTPQVPMMPGRVLPIQYPPRIIRETPLPAPSPSASTGALASPT
ncbi:hypothetical protein CPC08DRAFT_764161 [Agrocybe pediades]|nr:hypothetical protein CPC08DRAFT_764161 [Agrocybe pediades]